jgi:hypothetical protein
MLPHVIPQTPQPTVPWLEGMAMLPTGWPILPNWLVPGQFNLLPLIQQLLPFNKQQHLFFTNKILQYHPIHT